MNELEKLQQENKLLQRQLLLNDFASVVDADAKVLNRVLPLDLELVVEDGKGFVKQGDQNIEFRSFVNANEDLAIFAPAIFKSQVQAPAAKTDELPIAPVTLNLGIPASRGTSNNTANPYQTALASYLNSYYGDAAKALTGNA